MALVVILGLCALVDGVFYSTKKIVEAGTPRPITTSRDEFHGSVINQKTHLSELNYKELLKYVKSGKKRQEINKNNEWSCFTSGKSVNYMDLNSKEVDVLRPFFLPIHTEIINLHERKSSSNSQYLRLLVGKKVIKLSIQKKDCRICLDSSGSVVKKKPWHEEDAPSCRRYKVISERYNRI